jgi:3-hydroxyisobutyrate dehydrogenase
MAIALLGTGIMGSGMARSMRRAGLAVRAWNRSADRAAPLADEGIEVVARPGDAVAGADVVLTMLNDADSVAEVIEQVDAPEDTLWLQTSTVGLDGTERLAGIAARRGWVYVDSPVLGTKAPAEAGKLVVLASGPDDARAAAEPVFNAIGFRTLWLGPAGSGSRLKLVVNGWVEALTIATAQSVTLARGLGLDPACFLEAIDGQPTDSPYAHLKGNAIIEGNFAPAFTTSGAAKDANLIVAAAERAGIDQRFAATVAELFNEAVEQGHGGEDMASIARIFRK